jgi:hypothetical protein
VGNRNNRTRIEVSARRINIIFQKPYPRFFAIFLTAEGVAAKWPEPIIGLEATIAVSFNTLMFLTTEGVALEGKALELWASEGVTANWAEPIVIIGLEVTISVFDSSMFLTTEGVVATWAEPIVTTRIRSEKPTSTELSW